jgi:hypothetical protein
MKMHHSPDNFLTIRQPSPQGRPVMVGQVAVRAPRRQSGVRVEATDHVGERGRTALSFLSIVDPKNETAV